MLENKLGRVLAKVSQFEVTELGRRDTFLGLALARPSQLPTEIGTQSDLILQVADQSGADLIVLAMLPTHRFTDRFVSTDSYRVVCGAPCPVLTVHAG